MSSIFQGLVVAGKLNVGAGPIARYFRSLPLNAADAVVVGSGPIVRFAQGIPRNAAGEVVGLRATTATELGPGATPYGPNGEIEGDSVSAATLFYQGVPYTAGGLYATNGVGGAPVIVSKDFTLTPAQVSASTAGYRLSPLAGTLAPDNAYGGGNIDLVLAQSDDTFYVSTATNLPFPGISGNLAVALGVYQGPSRMILTWDGFDRYITTEPGIYTYMQSLIAGTVSLRLSAAPVGTA